MTIQLPLKPVKSGRYMSFLEAIPAYAIASMLNEKGKTVLVDRFNNGLPYLKPRTVNSFNPLHIGFGVKNSVTIDRIYQLTLFLNSKRVEERRLKRVQSPFIMDMNVILLLKESSHIESDKETIKSDSVNALRREKYALKIQKQKEKDLKKLLEKEKRIEAKWNALKNRL